MTVPAEAAVRVGAVVLSWNSCDYIGLCLDSLRQHEPSVGVYVVDNGSADGSIEFLRRNYPEAILIERTDNLGFAGGSNVGIQRALADGCEFVLLLNNDAVLDEPFIAACVHRCRQDPTIGIIGPAIIEMDPPGVVQCLGGDINLWTLTFRYRAAGQPYTRRDRATDVGFVLGAAMLIRRQVLEKVGLLDAEYFPAYVEEADLCHRARLAGFRSVVHEGCRISHRGATSSGGAVTSYRRFAANSLRFALKHLNAGQFAIAAHLIIWRGLYWKAFRRGVQ